MSDVTVRRISCVSVTVRGFTLQEDTMTDIEESMRADISRVGGPRFRVGEEFEWRILASTSMRFRKYADSLLSGFAKPILINECSCQTYIANYQFQK